MNHHPVPPPDPLANWLASRRNAFDAAELGSAVMAQLRSVPGSRLVWPQPLHYVPGSAFVAGALRTCALLLYLLLSV